MARDKGIWDPKPRVTNIKGANRKSLSPECYGKLHKSSLHEGVPKNHSPYNSMAPEPPCENLVGPFLKLTLDPKP